MHNVLGEGPYSVSFWMKIPNLTASHFYQPVQKVVWQNGWLLEIANMTDPAFLAFEIMRDAGTVIYLK